jgi:hypothetical protein
MSERDGFLQRWSRRKLDEKDAGQRTALQPVEPPAPAGLPAQAEPEEPFDTSLLPSIEEITGDSDIAAFLQKGVPEALKNAALRKVWASNPLFSEATGPLDYAWNFNDPQGVPGFGPLPADFDSSAMIDKLFSTPQKAEEAALASAPDEASAAISPHAEADGPDDRPVPVDAPALADSAQAQVPLIHSSSSAAEPAPVRADRLENSSEQAGIQENNSADLQPFRTAFRRRHGGAVPL